MATISQQLYWSGAAGDWSDATQWQDPPGTTADLTPAAGDTLYVAAGTVVIAPADAKAFGTIDDETLYLGSPLRAGRPTLDTSDETLGAGLFIELTGNYLNANWIARGGTYLEGTVDINGINSQLNLSAVADAASVPGAFTIASGAAIHVGGEGFFNFTAGELAVDGSLIVRGEAALATGTSLVAGGTVQLTQDSALTINGSAVGAISFAGGDATLQLGDAAAFSANVVGFTSSDSIVLSNIVADKAVYNPTAQQLVLTDLGAKVATIDIAGKFAANGFTVTSDGSSSTITVAGPNIVKDVLPVAIFGTVGEKISLATILTDAFGSTAHFGTVDVSYNDATLLANSRWGYWTNNSSDDALATWTVPGSTAPLTEENSLGVPVTDFADTYLTLGNVISPSADIKVPVVSQNGVVTEYLEYTINIVDPSLEGAAAKALTEPTVQDIIASAQLFDATYGDATIPDAEDCESIARDVAAAAGAVHGGDDVNPNTASSQTANLNQPDGFWQIAYDGADVTNPTTSWFDLLRPGDIVRLGWDNGAGGITSGHTTTVLSVAGDFSSIEVYDNTDGGTIGIHTVLASRWEASVNPAYVTIYRLRTDGRYLVQTQSADQLVHDTVYSDDIAIAGSNDTVYGGAANEMIGGDGADLQGLTLVNAHAGDFFQFDDALTLKATYVEATGVLTASYTLTGGGKGSSSINLPAGMAASFVIAAATDGSGQTITIDAPVTASVASFIANQSALDATIGGFSVAGPAAAIAAHFPAIYEDAKINAIVISDSAPLALTILEASDDTAALDELQNADASPYRLAITGTSANATTYASALKTLTSAGHVASLTRTGVTGESFTTHETVYDAQGAPTAQIYGGVTGENYSSFEYDYVSGNFIASKFFYPGEEIDYDGSGALTRLAFSGLSGAYSAYAYDFVGGVFAGSAFTYTSTPDGAAYSSFETDYDASSAFAGEKFFFTTVAGASGEEEDFDATAKLARVVLTGVTGQPYTSLEEDFSAGIFSGDKVFYTGIIGQAYTGEEVDANASGQLESVTFSGFSGTYSSVQDFYSDGALSAVIYDLPGIKGGASYAYQVVDSAGGAALQETVDLNSGGHAIKALAPGQTLTSLGDDKMTGDGATTFVFQAIYGAGAITNFSAGDSVVLPKSEFLTFAAMMKDATDVGGDTLIKAADGDSLTIKGVDPTALAADTSSFRFV